jgi:hypothetical protein
MCEAVVSSNDITLALFYRESVVADSWLSLDNFAIKKIAAFAR